MKFERLTVEHGLSQSICSAIAQDSLGFMWFGTQEGVNRNDGHSFKVYRAFQKPSNIGEGSVYSIAEDNSGNLLMGTSRGGWNKFDPERGTFTRFDNAGGIPEKTIFSIAQDHANLCDFARFRII